MFPLYDDVPIRRTPVVTYVLVAINVLVFVWSSHLPWLAQQKLAYQHGFVPKRMSLIEQDRAVVAPIQIPVYSPFWGRGVQEQELVLPPDRRQIWLSLLTCMFLHGSWMHVLGNMWFLWIFGDNVEDRLGRLRYLVLYFSAGLIASLCHWAVAPMSTTPVIGASGAIAGVLGAYAVTWPWARVSTLIFLVIFVTVVEIPALVVLGAWFLLQLWAGQESLRQAHGGGVAWWAHVGGFLAGMALMPLLGAGRREGREETGTGSEGANDE
jgi:membrane associated rhomboid family serine protease